MLKKNKPQFKNLLVGLKIQETLLGLPNQTVCKGLPTKKGQKDIEQQLDGKLQQVKNN